MRGTIVAFLFAWVNSAAVYAQSTGSISGTITDPNGAVIDSARIEAREASTGVTWQTISTDAGLYVLPTLPAGVYTLTVEHQGFKKHVQTEVEVRVGLRETIDTTLAIGDV
jgi:hypothetical protein